MVAPENFWFLFFFLFVFFARCLPAGPLCGMTTIWSLPKMLCYFQNPLTLERIKCAELDGTQWSCEDRWVLKRNKVMSLILAAWPYCDQQECMVHCSLRASWVFRELWGRRCPLENTFITSGPRGGRKPFALALGILASLSTGRRTWKTNAAGDNQFLTIYFDSTVA